MLRVVDGAEGCSVANLQINGYIGIMCVAGLLYIQPFTLYSFHGSISSSLFCDTFYYQPPFSPQHNALNQLAQKANS